VRPLDQNLLAQGFAKGGPARLTACFAQRSGPRGRRPRCRRNPAKIERKVKAKARLRSPGLGCACLRGGYSRPQGRCGTIPRG
jgi:hypothetical protein